MSVTLEQIEQEVGRRVGPYYRLASDRQVPSTATFSRAFVPGLNSTVELDLVTNLWCLRRGETVSGTTVEVLPDDRQRTVAIYTPSIGAVEVDRPWAQPPSSGEYLEFHHLDPEQELRPSVLAGLRRCRFEDRYSLGTGYIYEADLTAALPWLTNPRDVSMLQLAPFPSGFAGVPCNLPFETFMQAGHVCIRLNTGAGGPFFGDVLLTIQRSVITLVNGLDDPAGPLLDTDVLDVDLDYAAAAAHIEAWHHFPARMAAAAAGGLQASQKDAALEWSRQTYIHGPRKRDLWQHNEIYGYSGLPLVVNA